MVDVQSVELLCTENAIGQPGIMSRRIVYGYQYALEAPLPSLGKYISLQTGTTDSVKNRKLHVMPFGIARKLAILSMSQMIDKRHFSA
jgi:hypothetical protein